ncbi:MAG: hypothetical protein ACLFPQ_01200 [Candidatus Woesearchaeota archaeon]
MAKKGSLNLSINAIVVLIMAITMLGLGLAFISGTFGGATGKLNKLMAGLSDNEKAELEASADRITMAASTLEVQKGKSEDFFYAIRNDENGDLAVAAIEVKCDRSLEGPVGTGDISFSTFVPNILPPADSQVLPLQIKPSSGAKTTNYGCYIKVYTDNVDEDTEPDKQVAVSDIDSSGHYQDMVMGYDGTGIMYNDIANSAEVLYLEEYAELRFDLIVK